MISRSRLGALIVAGVLVGCGGGTTDPGPNPPPPPPPPAPPGPPSAIVVQSGDGQAATPGTAVAVVPSVLVRDAASRPVPGITVTFSADSGGGVVTAPVATTNSAGVASPGAWTLGATEGPQVLGVVAGSLPKVKIRATSRAPTTAITTQTITPGGGAITVNQPGPLNGLSITFPNGSMPGSTPISLSMASTAAMVLPQGIEAASPALVISAGGTSLRSPAILRFPGTPVAGRVMMVAARNSATGALTILAPVKSDASSRTVMLPSIDQTIFPPATGSAFLRAGGPLAQDNTDPVYVFLIAILPAELQKDFDSNFNPGVDDWDFELLPVALLPFLTPTQDGPALVVPEFGMVATMLWYYVNKRKAGGPPLNGSTQLQTGEPMSSRGGIRWSALADRDVRLLYSNGALVYDEWRDQLEMDPVEYSLSQFRAIKALFYQQYPKPLPVPVSLFIEGEDEETAPLMGIAIRSVGNTVDIVTPMQPGVSLRATYTEAQGMIPFLMTTPGGATKTVVAVAGLNIRAVLDDASLSSQYARVVAQTIGDSEGWPKATLQWEKAELDTGKVFLYEALQHWWECAGCPDMGPKPPQLPATASHVQFMRFGNNSGGAWSGLSQGFGSISISNTAITPPEKTKSLGFMLAMPGGSGNPTGWLDWMTATYRRMELQAAPATIDLTGDQTVTFTVTPDVTPPTGTTWRWVLETADGKDSVETALPSHTRDLKGGKPGTLTIRALEITHKREIGRTIVAVTAGAAPFWKITTFVDQDKLDQTFTQRIVTEPQSGLIAIDDEGAGRTVLRLRILQAGIWDLTNCCPPTVAPLPGELQQTLGIMPQVQHAVGPDFAGWNITRWAQSTQALDAGTLTGQYVDGITNYNIRDAGTQAGPKSVFGITATRNGTTMTGTITVTGWVSDETGVVSGIRTFRFPFTAVRLR